MYIESISILSVTKDIRPIHVLSVRYVTCPRYVLSQLVLRTDTKKHWHISVSKSHNLEPDSSVRVDTWPKCTLSVKTLKGVGEPFCKSWSCHPTQVCFSIVRNDRRPTRILSVLGRRHNTRQSYEKHGELLKYTISTLRFKRDYETTTILTY